MLYKISIDHARKILFHLTKIFSRLVRHRIIIDPLYCSISPDKCQEDAERLVGVSIKFHKFHIMKSL